MLWVFFGSFSCRRRILGTSPSSSGTMDFTEIVGKWGTTKIMAQHCSKALSAGVIANIHITYIYMLVGGFFATPLKNDGVRHLGWWHSQYDGKKMIQTTNQKLMKSSRKKWWILMNLMKSSLYIYMLSCVCIYIIYICYTDWWFQTCCIFHFIYGMSSFPLTNSIIFQDG